MGAFYISPTWGIETITTLIPIHLHLNKISGQQQLRITSLSSNHVINSLFENWHSKNTLPHCLFLKALMPKQWLKVKSSIVDTNNHLNRIFSSFDPLHKELSPSFRLVDSFSDHFYFHTVTIKIKKAKKPIFTNSTKVLKTFYQIPIQSSSFLIPVSRIISLHQYCTSAQAIKPLQKPSIMLSILHQQRQNYSLSDMESTKQFKFPTHLTS